MKQQDVLSRKQISFDLNQKSLRLHYPRPPKTVNPFFYRKAYSDIAKFMENHGFSKRQQSVYVSDLKLHEQDVSDIVAEMSIKMPWLNKCVNEIDVTTVSNRYTLKPVIDPNFNEFKLEPFFEDEHNQNQAIATQAKRNTSRRSGKEWDAAIAAKREALPKTAKQQEKKKTIENVR